MTNMNTNYTDERMNLNDVCQWLTNKGYEGCADAMMEAFKYHTWTKDGMLRKDVIEDIIVGAFDTLTFRELECDVITYMNIVPLHEAHID
jgi:hypothetical protein